MFCFKCGNSVIKGCVPVSKQALVFVPDGGKMPLSTAGTGPDGIRLTKLPFWKRIKAEAYYCKECKFVVIPADTENNQI